MTMRYFPFPGARRAVPLTLVAALIYSCGLWDGGLSRSAGAFVAMAQDTGAQADDATSKDAPSPAWPKVTPKRIGVPSSGTSKRITVQIRPSDMARQRSQSDAARAALPGGAVGEAAPDLSDWFWSRVPHDAANASPERFAIALQALEAEGAQPVATPDFQHVTDLAKRYGVELLVHSLETAVSPALALAVMSVESAGAADAVSPAGAQGLMQLIPATAERFGVKDSMDASENIRGGIAYLDWLLKQFNGDLSLALAGYNAGENAVREYNGPPPYAETRAYVPKVLAAWNVARGLCLTPPELYSDGCVFATSALGVSK